MKKEIFERRSMPVLIEPPPSDDELKQVLQAAQVAPDHGRLRPWHFLIIRGKSRDALGELFVQAVTAESPSLAKERVERIRNMPLRAPLIIVAVTRPVESNKIPLLEQVVATGAAVENMLLMLQSLHYGAMWRTGEMAYKDLVKRGLGLGSKDIIVGYIYVGTAGSTPKPRPNIDFDENCTEWTG